MALIKLSEKPFVSSTGGFLTRALFYEEWREMPIENRKYEPVFTLVVPRAGLIDARTTFIELMDPTGYKWATEYLGSWRHWEQLMKTSWFPPHVADWISEMKTKVASDALIKIKSIADSDNAQSLAANKYLVEEGWIKGQGRGRPSKAELKGELKRQAAMLEIEDQDLKRIGGLGVITGGKR